MIGRTLGYYRIVEKIGAGGMGEVYRARDERLERDVALKVLSASGFTDQTARSRLLQEARAASQLNHPHICTVHEVGEADGQAYIAMEYVEGRPLSEFIRGESLPTATLLRYGVQMADALAHAHQRGVIHRDLKSSNVVITPEGRAKILDFGLAKRLQQSELQEATQSQATLAEAGRLMGTLPYMAPEQLRGEPADARSDIWALGVTLYEAAAGKRPFRGETSYEVSSAILRESPPALPKTVPAGVQSVIQRCLEKERGQRYQQAGEVRAALEAIQTGTPRAGYISWNLLSHRLWLAIGSALLLFVAVLGLANLDVLRDRLVSGSAPGEITSIAVLPLENLSGDPEQEYFADGMTEALITDLSKIGALKVISRTSAMRYKGADKPLPEIARELGVDAVIEGSVMRVGNEVRITAQLIHAATDEHLWAESYQRELRDILALQSEVARAIAQEIKIAVTPEEQARLASARPVNPEAHEAYLKGRYYWNKRTIEGFKQGLNYFQQAAEKDPGYAPAYVGLADSYLFLGGYGVLPPEEASGKAKTAVLQALEIDDTLAEAHATLASIKQDEWDWLGAEREYKRAILLNPNYATAHHWYSIYLGFIGKHDQAVAEAKRARELDPTSLIINSSLGARYFYARRFEEAMEQYRKTLELDADFWLAHYGMGYVYLQEGMPREAIVELQKAKQLFGSEPEEVFASLFALAYVLSGQRDRALKILDDLVEESERTSVPPSDLATVYAILGDNDRAFQWLEKAYNDHDSGLVAAKVSFLLDPLRSDPRFDDLLRRMNFPAEERLGSD